jgi:hypothetical protein
MKHFLHPETSGSMGSPEQFVIENPMIHFDKAARMNVKLRR